MISKSDLESQMRANTVLFRDDFNFEGKNPFKIFLECCVFCIKLSKILLQELLNETKSKRGAAVFNYFINLAKLKPNCVTQPWRQFCQTHLFDAIFVKKEWLDVEKL